MPDDYPFPWKFDRQRYAELYLLSGVTEFQVQQAILDLLSTYQVDAVPIDAGGRKQRGRFMGAARRAGVDLCGAQNVKTGGAIPSGYSDLEGTLAPHGKGLYIEVKAPAHIGKDDKVIRPAGKPTPAQLDFLLSKHHRGAVCLVAWSAHDVLELLGPRLDENRRGMR